MVVTSAAGVNGDYDHLYCVGKDHVVAYKFSTGTFLEVVVELTALNRQAIVVLP